MATSPIYSWPEPDNTDLVKNGALAIRTLGNAIDTTMATMTPKSLVDAKGDLIAASANDTPARLAVGNNGETLVADSSTATGLRYTGNYAAGKNAIINGAFNVWQRGTSFTPASGSNIFTADRFNGYCTFSAGTYTISQQAFTAGTAPVAGYESQYFMRHAFPTSGTISYFEVGQKIEDVRTFAGQTVTLSFWAKASSSTSQFTVTFAQNYGSGGSATTYATGAFAPSLTTSWQRFTGTFTVPSIAGKTIGTNNFLQLVFYSGGVATSSVFDIWGVQVEAGSVATAFQTATGTIQGELAACQRYYERRTYNQVCYPYVGQAYASTAVLIPITYSEKRGTPTLTLSGTWKQLNASGTGQAATYGFSHQQVTESDLTATTSGMTAGNASLVETTSGTTYIEISAEL